MKHLKDAYGVRCTLMRLPCDWDTSVDPTDPTVGGGPRTLPLIPQELSLQLDTVSSLTTNP